MIRSIYIVIHSINLDKSKLDYILIDSTIYLTQIDYKVLKYLTFGSIYIMIHYFNLWYRSINHMETIPIDPSWLDIWLY